MPPIGNRTQVWHAQMLHVMTCRCQINFHFITQEIFVCVISSSVQNQTLEDMFYAISEWMSLLEMIITGRHQPVQLFVLTVEYKACSLQATVVMSLVLCLRHFTIYEWMLLCTDLQICAVSFWIGTLVRAVRFQ